MKQRTILREVSLNGKSLHTGEQVNLTLKPAPEDTGVVFRCMSAYGTPEIKPSVDKVSEVVRATTISDGNNKIHTIEHILSALHGCGVDNVFVEMDASEPPILDGSAKLFVKLITEAEPVEQKKDREYFVVKETVSVIDGDRSIIALPYDGFRITCTSTDDRGVHTQHLTLDIDPETYISQIADARTFAIYEDIEELIKIGKVKGGSLDSAIVIKGDKIISKEPLRFKDEFVRHKMLDIIGDLMLLQKPIRGHIIAVKTGHALNAKLSAALQETHSDKKAKEVKQAPKKAVSSDDTSLDIRGILDTIPHRYPFVMIDRILEFKNKDELIALKNVTFNEPYFNGHFPGQPVMPGVLQVEAMAQAAGILMMRRVNSGNKIAFFMSCDKVKFRKTVEPGDQLEIHVKIIKTRGDKLAVAEGKCYVDGKVVSNAELMFTLMDN